MSNYLNSLVARQLESESLVQPRLSSVFEPPAFAPVLRRLKVDSRAAAPNASIESVAFINVEHGAAGPSEADNPLEPSPGSSSFTSSSDETRGKVWRGRQTMESWPAELTSGQPGDERQVRGPQNQSTAAITSETPLVPGRDSGQLLSAPPAIQRQRKADDPANSTRLIQTTNNERTFAETKWGLESTKDPRVIRPRVALPNEKAGNNSAMPVALPASDPAPVINVTIGRIEVRATTPATSARKQPSTKPLMSLDEYLQRRTRGGGS